MKNAAIVVAGATAIVLIGFTAYWASKPGEADVRAAADGAAHELERTPVKGLGLHAFDVEEALSVTARDSRGRSYASSLRVTAAGQDSRGDLYEITNADGNHPVCLSIKVEPRPGSDAPVFPTTSVRDGPCQQLS